MTLAIDSLLPLCSGPQQRREHELPLLGLAAHPVYAGCAGPPRGVAAANEDLDDRHLGRPGAVHFLRFALPDAMRDALWAGHAAVLGCAHPGYAWQCQVPAPMLQQLCAALQPGTRRQGMA